MRNQARTKIQAIGQTGLLTSGTNRSGWHQKCLWFHSELFEKTLTTGLAALCMWTLLLAVVA